MRYTKRQIFLLNEIANTMEKILQTMILKSMGKHPPQDPKYGMFKIK